MNVNVKALGNVAHGRINAAKDESFVVNKIEATELEKAGLVEIVGDNNDEPEETKMEPITMNKMADAPSNKSRSKKAD